MANATSRRQTKNLNGRPELLRTRIHRDELPARTPRRGARGAHRAGPLRRGEETLRPPRGREPRKPRPRPRTGAGSADHGPAIAEARVSLTRARVIKADRTPVGIATLPRESITSARTIPGAVAAAAERARQILVRAERDAETIRAL